MKIITIGMSPYTLLSHGKTHASILKHLFYNHHKVSALCFGHDITYFTPEPQGSPFNFKFDNHKIPIIPLSHTENDVITIYEVFKKLEPDLVITIGEITDTLFMKAVKMFYTKPFKWLSILLNYQHPINEEHKEILQDTNAIICSSQETYDDIYNENLNISIQNPGFNNLEYSQISRKNQNFTITTIGKNMQTDNIPTIMSTCKKLKQHIPNLQLYIHTNLYDKGELNLLTIKEKIDPNNTFIQFPEKYISMCEGTTDQELTLKLSQSHIYVSIPMISSTSRTILEAMNCNCTPIMSNCNSNKDIAKDINLHTNIETLVDTIPIYTTGETILNIANPKHLEEQIIKIKQNWRENSKEMSEIALNYTESKFLSKISKTIKELAEQNDEILKLEV